MRGMKIRLLACGILVVLAAAAASPAFARQFQSPVDSHGHFQLALPDRNGAFEWDAPGYEVAQMTVKPGSRELGVRGVNKEAKLMFIAFIFAVDEPVDSAGTCRTGDITENTQDPDIRVVGKTELLPIISSMRFVPGYAPQFKDVFLYGMIFYEKQDYKNAAPYLEQSIGLAAGTSDPVKWRRVATDNAGIAYGISGNTKAARNTFEAAIAKDPDYPMHYYNLACADASEKNLEAAKKHLQQAFERKANALQGEALPDPKTDDSFTPYKNDPQFWAFVTNLK
jgi:tetratricopeptide (TPR) repeat protein